MYEFQQKKRIRKIFHSPFSVLLMLFITVLLVRGAWQVLSKERQSRSDMELVKKQLESAKAKEIELNTNIEKLGTESGIEKEIRERFSVKKDGEEVVLIVDSDNSTSTQGGEESFWVKFKNWFADIF